MSLPTPAHLLDTVGSAASTTREAAGGLLHDALSAVRGRRHRSGRWIPLAALGALVAVVTLMSARRRFGLPAQRVAPRPNGPVDKPSPAGRNGTMTQHADNAKGRIKEAAGALTDNDDLQAEGKRDQQVAKAKEAVDKARDAVNDGIDSLKDKLTKS
jgi:uncharacterized protein YjbJ (UPF0337 family)